MKKVLFICTGNTCRSPMAEGLLKDYLNGDFIVESRGVSVFFNGPANENAIKVMEEDGIDISNHTSKQIDEEILRESDLIITMTNGHRDLLLNIYPEYKEKTFTLKAYDNGIKGDISDPFGGNIEEYRKTKDQIKKLIKEKKWD